MDEKDVNNSEVTPDNDGGQAQEAPTTEEAGQGEQGTDSQPSTEQPVEDSGKDGSTKEGGSSEEKSYKELQAEFTRRNQEWKAKEKDLEQWKQIKSSPDFKEFIESKQQKEKQQEADYESIKSNLDPEQRQAFESLEKFVNPMFKKFVEPYVEKIQQLEQDRNIRLKTEGEKVWNEFASNSQFPKAKENRQEIIETAVKHQVPLEKAYAILYEDDYKEALKQEVLRELEEKKKANLNIPSSTSPSPSIDKGASVEEIWKKMKAQKNIDSI